MPDSADGARLVGAPASVIGKYDVTVPAGPGRLGRSAAQVVTKDSRAAASGINQTDRKGVKMRRVRIVGLCLAAIFAISAIVAATASAASPEFMVCVKSATKTGAFTDKNCSTPSAPPNTGKYELAPVSSAKKLALKGKGGTLRIPVFVKGLGIVGSTECKTSKSAGQVTGPKTYTYKLELSKCLANGESATTQGSKTGTITSATLEGTLVPLAGEKCVVGTEVKGTGAGGELKHYKTSGGTEVTNTGAVTGTVSGNVCAFSKKFSTTFAVNVNGEPTIPSSEPLLAAITGVGTLEAGISTSIAWSGEAFKIA